MTHKVTHSMEKDNHSSDNHSSPTGLHQNLPVGIYQKESDSLSEATLKTIQKMVKLMPRIKKSSKVLILGYTHAPAARFLEQKYQCKIECLVSEEALQNKSRQNIPSEPLGDRINVTIGRADALTFPGETFDVVWSQDVFWSNPEKRKVFRQITNVLKPEGRLIFTDIMKGEQWSKTASEELPEWFDSEILTTLKSYELLASRVDLEKVYIREMSLQLLKHHSVLLNKAEADLPGMTEKSEKALADKYIQDLKKWITAVEKGYLTWGILQFQKRNV